MKMYGKYKENQLKHKLRQNWCRWYHSKRNDLTKKMRLITYPETCENPSKDQFFHPRPNCSTFNSLFIFPLPTHSCPHLQGLWTRALTDPVRASVLWPVDPVDLSHGPGGQVSRTRFTDTNKSHWTRLTDPFHGPGQATFRPFGPPLTMPQRNSVKIYED